MSGFDVAARSRANQLQAEAAKERARQALKHYREGMEVPDIAKLLGVGEKVARSYLTRNGVVFKRRKADPVVKAKKDKGAERCRLLQGWKPR